MSSFPKGKRILQLLLRREDLVAMRSSAIFPLVALTGALLLWLSWRFIPVSDPRLLINWLAAGGIICSFFLTFQLYRTDLRRRKAEARAKTSEFKFGQLY